MRRACCTLLPPLLLLHAAAAASVPQTPPKPPPSAPSSAAADELDVELLSRVVEARVSTKEHLLPAALSEELDDLDDFENMTQALLKGPKRALLRTKAWLREKQPALWLAINAVLVENSKANLDEQSALAAIRSQVDLGQDYHIAVVTTAALPWMTGTAVNPLLRAAHLAHAGRRVSLVIPWLHPLEQPRVFPPQTRFEQPREQEAYIRQWLRTRAGIRAHFDISFYAARYDSERGSILPVGDITRFIEPAQCDVCVLEEPEHLTWYHHGPNWRHRFKLVVGVVHTNYLFYARTWQNGGPFMAETLKAVNQFMCAAYCDKVIKLSDALQPLPRSLVENVHGVRADFLAVGRRASRRRWKRGAYFLGKVLWAKGHRLLIDHLVRQREKGYDPTHVDIYGKGEDLEAVQRESEDRGLALTFHGPRDHASSELQQYKVFVNPSQSEVLATTTAEALAMGKYVVIERHPSNEFFLQFRNTLAYETPEEFLLQLRFALATTPQPLTADERRRLSWEGATERFLAAVTNSTLGDTLPTLGDHTTQWVHQSIQKGGKMSDVIRQATGAGPISHQSWLPKHLEQNRDATCTEIVEMSVRHSPPVPA